MNFVGQELLHHDPHCVDNVARMETFGQRLRRAILAADVTQTRLGEDVGRTKGAVSQWVNDESEPDLRTLAKICERLQVSADYLVRGIEARYLDEQTAAIVARVSSLDESARGGLHELIFGPAVADDEVERRMPATKKFARGGRQSRR